MGASGLLPGLPVFLHTFSEVHHRLFFLSNGLLFLRRPGRVLIIFHKEFLHGLVFLIINEVPGQLVQTAAPVKIAGAVLLVGLPFDEQHVLRREVFLLCFQQPFLRQIVVVQQPSHDLPAGKIFLHLLIDGLPHPVGKHVILSHLLILHQKRAVRKQIQRVLHVLFSSRQDEHTAQILVFLYFLSNVCHHVIFYVNPSVPLDLPHLPDILRQCDAFLFLLRVSLINNLDHRLHLCFVFSKRSISFPHILPVCVPVLKIISTEFLLYLCISHALCTSCIRLASVFAT